MDRPVKLKRRSDGQEVTLVVGAVEVTMTMGQWSQIVAHPLAYPAPTRPVEVC